MRLQLSADRGLIGFVLLVLQPASTGHRGGGGMSSGV